MKWLLKQLSISINKNHKYASSIARIFNKIIETGRARTGDAIIRDLIQGRHG